MRYTLKNEELLLEFESHGGELVRILDKNGKERLWTGDETFWKGKSPILFPFIGRLINQKYRYQGKEYAMTKHGFARDNEFTMVSQNDHSISFSFSSNEETLKIYPFPFELILSYELNQKEINVTWTVVNKGEKEMPFSIGGHPAFVLPPHKQRNECFIKLDQEPTSITFIGTGYYEDKNILQDIQRDGLYIPLKEDLFKDDALVFENEQLHEICFCDKNKVPYVGMKFSSPVVGIWSPYKAECPFVCIEPWYGICDKLGYAGNLEERKWTQILLPKEKKDYCYTIEIF